MNADFRDLLAEFNARGVEFIVVGVHALAAHGRVRATKDLDVWVCPSPENAARVMAALKSFGAPLHDLKEGDLSTPGIVVQIGVAPVRIDILTEIDAVSFDDVWSERFQTIFVDQPASVLSRRRLLINQRAAGRKQVLADVEWLENNDP